MALALQVQDPKGSHRVYCAHEQVSIGRDPAQATVVLDNEYVSRLHCLIQRRHDGQWVMIHRGRNLSRLDDRELKTPGEQAVLRERSILTVAGYRIELLLDEEAPTTVMDIAGVLDVRDVDVQWDGVGEDPDETLLETTAAWEGPSLDELDNGVSEDAYVIQVSRNLFEELRDSAEEGLEDERSLETPVPDAPRDGETAFVPPVVSRTDRGEPLSSFSVPFFDEPPVPVPPPGSFRGARSAASMSDAMSGSSASIGSERMKDGRTVAPAGAEMPLLAAHRASGGEGGSSFASSSFMGTAGAGGSSLAMVAPISALEEAGLSVAIEGDSELGERMEPFGSTPGLVVLRSSMPTVPFPAPAFTVLRQRSLFERFAEWFRGIFRSRRRQQAETLVGDHRLKRE